MLGRFKPGAEQGNSKTLLKRIGENIFNQSGLRRNIQLLQAYRTLRQRVGPCAFAHKTQCLRQTIAQGYGAMLEDNLFFPALRIAADFAATDYDVIFLFFRQNREPFFLPALLRGNGCPPQMQDQARVCGKRGAETRTTS